MKRTEASSWALAAALKRAAQELNLWPSDSSAPKTDGDLLRGDAGPRMPAPFEKLPLARSTSNARATLKSLMTTRVSSVVGCLEVIALGARRTLLRNPDA